MLVCVVGKYETSEGKKGLVEGEGPKYNHHECDGFCLGRDGGRVGSRWSEHRIIIRCCNLLCTDQASIRQQDSLRDDWEVRYLSILIMMLLRQDTRGNCGPLRGLEA